jgi:uncharacterized protein YqgC (DUF456 family)
LPLLPSFYAAKEGVHPWSIGRWSIGGAALGAVAGIFKALGALTSAATTVSVGEWIAAKGPEIVAAAVAFALLCAAVAALRNFLARRLIWPDMP